MAEPRPGTGGQGQPSTSDTGTAHPEALAVSMGLLARDLDEVDDPEAMMAAIVKAAVAMIPGADEGSISIVLGRKRVMSNAPTGDLPIQVDAIQEEAGQGPCLDAVYEHQTVRVRDLASEQRWPLFAQRASAVGAASMLSLQLYVVGDNLGALNLYARAPDAFTDESEQVGLLFAAHAAIAYASARKEYQLAQALASRDLIGQAKGILMERYAITGERAFLVLTRVSQHGNRKLYDVARELVLEGTVKGLTAQPPAARTRAAGLE